MLALLLVTVLGLHLTPAEIYVLAEQTRKGLESAVDLASTLRQRFLANAARVKASKQEIFESPAQRASQVARLRLCPRRLTLYKGEEYSLVPLPLGNANDAIHGALLGWESRDSEIARVSSIGEIIAVKPGRTIVSVCAGTARAGVLVDVREGFRPILSDAEYDRQHENDCDDPDAIEAPDESEAFGYSNQPTSSLRRLNLSTRFASLRINGAPNRSLKLRTMKKTIAAQTVPAAEIDGDGDDSVSPAATSYNNAIGSPRFAAQLESQASGVRTRQILGSYDYVLEIPVLSLPGRGIGVELALVYNSQLWNKDVGKMTFNYNKGWPAAGWSIGYGRIIRNYDGTATGDESGNDQSNSPGNRLLIQPDGTRLHLQQQWNAAGQQWDFDSTDGTFLHMTDDRLRYPDGTSIQYQDTNNRLLPARIETRNGDQIGISYLPHNSSTFRVRWAIDKITDTLGRIIQFNYDPVTSALVSISAPDESGSPRQLVQIDYQTITLSHDFTTGVSVTAPSNDQLAVVHRIYDPETGRGYLFSQYSSYGCARLISKRIGMTASSDGTEIAYTRYNYSTAVAMYPGDPDVQAGQLNDPPQYTERREWWQGKTDDNGSPTNDETVYRYTRQTDTLDQSETHIEEDLIHLTKIDSKIGTNPGLQSNGKLIETTFKDGAGVVKRRTELNYVTGADGGVQLGAVESFDEEGNRVRTETSYGNYGRVSEIREFGYTSTVQRKTTFSYVDSQSYIDSRLLQLVNKIQVFNSTPANVAKTEFIYDDYAAMGGMEFYGMPANPFPPNHDAAYDQNKTIRGNLTGVRTYSDIEANVSVTRNSKYDLFGNVLEAQVSCCGVKTANFGSGSGSAMLYSLPRSTTDGREGVAPFLKTSYVYNFFTSLNKQVTDPDNLVTSFMHDESLRLVQANSPTGAVTVTKFDKDGNGKDSLSYFRQVIYTDADSIQKVITSRTWFDGAGRTLRSGVGQGISPVSYDAVKSVYDSLGRLLKQSNPYAGNSSGDGSPQYWTTNEYDALSRVIKVTLPDAQTIQTSYNGDEVTVTDQVGRKRKSQFDAFGRLIAVTEQDTATGSLSVVTNYTYDPQDNLTGVNQSGQTRTFIYDALSRLKTQTTPEAGIVTYSYWDFDEVKKQTDARGVETHYSYDSLNRRTKIWYTGPGGDDTGTIRPALPGGVEPTADVMMQYNTAPPGNGAISRIDDAAGFETYSYDSFGRNTSKNRTFTGVAGTFTTGYQYNQIGQQTRITYPSGRPIRTNHNSRGQLSGLDSINGSTSSPYLSAVGYDVAGLITSFALGNGVAESFDYSPTRLQLICQKVMRNEITLMNLCYDYQADEEQSGAETTAGNSGQLMRIRNNESGQPSAVNGQPKNREFAYNNQGDLMTETRLGSQLRFSYDRWGNRTGVWDRTVGGTQIQNVALTQQPGAPLGVPNNRIATVGGVSHTYDSAGNLTSDGGHTYRYDAAGRLAKVDAGTSNEASYCYDSQNRRMKKVVGTGAAAVTTYYIWEGAVVIAEYSTPATQTFGGTKYYSSDRLSTQLMTDIIGTVIGTQDHLPFGEGADTFGEVEKHRLTSYERDVESGKDYAVNRNYAPGEGRFIQPGPVAGGTGAPQSLNRYLRANNDPINLNDPLGLNAAPVRPRRAGCLTGGYPEDYPGGVCPGLGDVLFDSLVEEPAIEGGHPLPCNVVATGSEILIEDNSGGGSANACAEPKSTGVTGSGVRAPKSGGNLKGKRPIFPKAKFIVQITRTD